MTVLLSGRPRTRIRIRAELVRVARDRASAVADGTFARSRLLPG